MGQINITKGQTPIAAPSGKLGLSFDANDNLIIIDESGNYIIVGTGSGGSTNIIAELGVGLEAALPAIGSIGESYVTTDTLKVFTVKDALSWNEVDLEKGQFVVNTLSAIELYSFDGTSLQLLQALETAQSIIDKIGDGTTISSIYLPSYVDEVVEYANLAAFPVTGLASTIYLALDSSIAYRWSGTVYVQISSTPTYTSQAEAEAGAENTKVMTALRVLQSWVYQIANYSVTALNTTAKTIIGAINELLLKFVGVYNDRGYFDASVNTFPTGGGSGTAGAILKGDCFTIQTAGNSGGVDLFEGLVIRALIDTPGQVASNWYVPSFGIGYTPENISNKEVLTIDDSTVKYPANKVVKDLADALQNEIDNLSIVQQATLYYLEHVDSDITGYEKLLKIPMVATEATDVVNIDSNEVLFDAHVTEPGEPSVLGIPAGLWTCHAHVQFSSHTGQNYVHFDIYTRDTGGTETFHFRMSSDDINTNELVEYNLQEVQAAISLTLDDRIVVKVYAQTTGGAKTATLHYSGSTNFAFVSPPPIAGGGYATTEYVDSKEILLPATQPAIVSGTPDIMTFDCEDRTEAFFEPRLSVGTLTIPSDFTLDLTNAENALLIGAIFSLTGTVAITFLSDFLCSIPSSIGDWTSQVLTLSAGTDDLIEIQLLRYSTNSKWILKVSEVAV